MYIDVHAHILPHVDDGAKNREESLAMLKMLKAQGVMAVAATPHFYASREKSFEEYLVRIESSYNALNAAKTEDLPEVHLGSEVHFFSGISSFGELAKLCIGNSKYILIELPYKKISDKTINEIVEISLSRGLVPILAHIERYRRFEGFDKVKKLIEEGFAIGQVNAYSFLRFKYRKSTLKLLRDGYAKLIAGDCHSPELNPPKIEKALALINKKLGQQFLDELHLYNDGIYKEIRGIN